jgi:hypothetical protein
MTDLTRLTALDVAALIGSADKATVDKIDGNEMFTAAQTELLDSTTLARIALQRQHRAEQVMAIVARQFFTREALERSKWEE